MGYGARQFKRRSPLRGLVVLVIAGLIAWRLATLAAPHLRHALTGTILSDGPHVPPTVCRAGPPLAGVYNPRRLAVHANCVSAIGRVVFILHAPDGDLHISLLPDRGYWRLLDQRNYTAQGGTLVVEIVPADQATVHVPAIGAHVQVTGTYVTDLEHGWREIHPAWRIRPV